MPRIFERKLNTAREKYWEPHKRKITILLYLIPGAHYFLLFASFVDSLQSAIVGKTILKLAMVWSQTLIDFWHFLLLKINVSIKLTEAEANILSSFILLLPSSIGAIKQFGAYSFEHPFSKNAILRLRAVIKLVFDKKLTKRQATTATAFYAVISAIVTTVLITITHEIDFSLSEIFETGILVIRALFGMMFSLIGIAIILIISAIDGDKGQGCSTTFVIFIVFTSIIVTYSNFLQFMGSVILFQCVLIIVLYQRIFAFILSWISVLMLFAFFSIFLESVISFLADLFNIKEVNEYLDSNT